MTNHNERVAAQAITPLAPEVVERIAAGEVIERPASVVRELIENALDAGASEIRVDLREGGLRLIRVADDGAGIAAGALELACQPHTTSKLHSLRDLEALRSFGFRGEALASVAAIAELELLSAADDSGLASGLRLRPGVQAEPGLAARARGTTVTVRDLFVNVPARRAILHGPRREGASAAAVVRAYALVHPDIRFALVADGQLVFRTAGPRLEDAFMTLYGSDASRGLLTFTAEVAETSIEGAVCSRAFSQPTREHVVVAVNGRPIANRALLQAAETGYRPLLRKGRHPLLVVSIVAPPEAVDVNVHPAKAHVLLRGERGIAAHLRDAIHQALGSTPVSAIASASRPAVISVTRPVQLRLPAAPQRHRPRKARPMRTDRPLAPGEEVLSHAGYPELTPLGQVDDSLIVAQAPDGSLYLVDQHRAHERILYERLRAIPATASRVTPSSVVGGYRKSAAAPLASQLLLDPVLVELTPQQATLLAARLDELAGLGLECQPFGGSTFLVRALPVPEGTAHQPTTFAADLARDAAEDSEDWLDHVRISLACRSAIRRGQPLSPSDQQALLAGLRTVSAPAVCPHGSPLLLCYSRALLARLFEW
jgi:DNA mismatch repair protein MutL